MLQAAKGNRRSAQLASALALTAAVVLAPLALAAPADHDPSFGTDGVVKTDIRTTGSSDYINDLALQPDGKIVAVGRSSNTGAVPGCPTFGLTVENCGNANNNWSLARYNPDGSLDASFAIAGRGSVTLDGFNFGWGELRAVALEAGGTIIAVGDRGGGSDNILGAVVRFTANGTPATHVALPAFGDGRAVTTLEDVAIQPDGKIVVVGTRQAGGTNDANMTVARLNSDLSLDTSFGSGGLVTHDVGEQDEARALAIQPDGKIVVTGYATLSTGLAAVTVRLTSGGALEASAISAVDAVSQGRTVVLQPDGKIVVGGASNGGLTLFRYLSDLTPDSTFGAGGVVTTNVGVVNPGINDVVIQGNGKIAAVGNQLSVHDSGEVQVVRYSADGSLDAGFGTGGIAREFTGSWSLGNSIVLQPDGKLVFGGLVRKTIGAADGSDYVLVRYIGDLVTPPAPPAPDLALTITDSPDPAAPRGALTYTLQVVNHGDAGASAVTLSADAPKLGMDSATSSQGTCRKRGTKLSCDLGSIGPSGSASVTITGTAPRRAGVLELSASVAAPGDANSANDSAVEQTTVQ